MTQGITSLADLRPGDIMFGPIGGAVGLGVGLGQLVIGEGFRQGSLSVRHVGIVTEGGERVPPFDLPRGPRAAWIDGHRHEIPMLAQAMPDGAEIVPMTQETHWTERHAYVRLPEDYPGQAGDAAAIARLMVAEGVGYSFASYPALAAWRFGFKAARLERWIDRRGPYAYVSGPDFGGPDREVRLPVEAICSVFADQAWSLAGKRVMEGVARQCVTPGAMADQLSHRAGAVWCRPYTKSLVGGQGGTRTWTVPA